jgi:putative hydrolase of the HAD superfamily
LSKYKHLFFDLDHTLWDYDTNAAAALTDLHAKHDLHQKSGITADELISTFFKVNYALWDDFDIGVIGKEDIRKYRFPNIYDSLGVSHDHIPLNIEVEYVDLCPTKKATMPMAHEVLDYLNGKFHIHVITNGFKEIQTKKMESALLAPFFTEVITSESAGYRKPDPRVFEFALDKAGASKQESIMIGDNLTTDIGGARNAGIDQVFFNPDKRIHQEKITHEIQNLGQLMELL